MSPTPLQVLQSWKETADQLATLKAKEAELRRAAVALIATPGKEEGVERIILANGYEAEIKHSLNYNVTNKNGEVKYLQSIMPPEIFADLFRVKYELSVTAYRALSQAQRNVVDYCLTVTSGMPALELKPPSEERII